MDNIERQKIEQIIQTRNQAHRFYMKNSRVYRSFLGMEHETFKDGELSKKTKELMATAISVVINCESCMEWHINQAIDGGATEAEVIEAIEVGIEMSGGPGTVAARFAMNVLEYYKKDSG